MHAAFTYNRQKFIFYLYIVMQNRAIDWILAMKQ